tara:strand:- start:355 stop:774 length:420 start_codon:yes stop_codon:yes gene_type:complete
MKNRILLSLIAVLFLVFHWHWSAMSIGLSSTSPISLHQFLAEVDPDREPVLLIEMSEIEIPWTRFFPLFQFGKIEGVQRTSIEYGGDVAPYTTVNLVEVSRRIGILPELFLRERISAQLETYLIENTDGHNGHHFEIAE